MGWEDSLSKNKSVFILVIPLIIWLTEVYVSISGSVIKSGEGHIQSLISWIKSGAHFYSFIHSFWVNQRPVVRYVWLTGTQYLTQWVWVQSDNNSVIDAVMALSFAFNWPKSSALLHRRRYIDWLASDTTNFRNAIQVVWLFTIQHFPDCRIGTTIQTQNSSSLQFYALILRHRLSLNRQFLWFTWNKSWTQLTFLLIQSTTGPQLKNSLKHSFIALISFNFCDKKHFLIFSYIKQCLTASFGLS